jgi:tetratricopeptide (TPR) repeat protein
MGDPDKRWLLTTPDGKTLEYGSIAELIKDAQALHALDPRPSAVSTPPAAASSPQASPHSATVMKMLEEEAVPLSSRELVSDPEPPLRELHHEDEEKTAEVEVPKVPSRSPPADVAEAQEKAPSAPPPKAESTPPQKADSKPPQKVASTPPQRAAGSEDEDATPLSMRDLEVAEPSAEMPRTSTEELSISDVTLSDETSSPAAAAESSASEAAEDEPEAPPESLDPALLEEVPASSRRDEDRTRAAGTLPPANPPPKSKRPGAASSVAPAAPEARSSSLNMVALAAAVAIAFVGAIAYLSNPAQNTTTSAGPSSNVPQLTQVVEAEQALNDGDLQTAEEKLARVAENDPNPRVLVDLARVANARADLSWLTLRLLRSGAPEEGATRDKLRELAKKARDAAEAAVVAAPADPSAVRAKLDALRIANEVEAARALVEFVASGRPYEAETDYVLATLDLAETSPPLPDIIVRLRAAADREGKLARARVALIHALMLAGDTSGANAEVDKLAKLSPPHPLLQIARANLGARPASTSSPSPSATATTTATSTAPTAESAATARPKASSATSSSAAATVAPADVHRAALAARRKGDFATAKQLYESALSKNPGDSEALAGLGDTLRATGDSAGAIAKYRAALSVNPKFLPAQLGLADTLWDSGQRGEAQAKYQEISTSYAPELVPDRVKQRANP